MTLVRRAYAETAYGQVHYREAGRRETPPLLMLHQAPSHSEMYQELMQRMAEDYRCIAPDLPGYGNSDPLDVAPTIKRYALAMYEFLETLDISHCHLFGHHTGAAIAVQLEYDYPGTARRIALSGPPLLSDEVKRALPGAAEPYPAAADGSHLQKHWARIRAKDSTAPLALTQREVLSALAIDDLYQKTYKAVTEQNFGEQLAALQCPVLVFAGTEDGLYPFLNASYALLRQGQRAEIPGANTYVCDKHADQVALLLRGFLNR